MAAVRLVAGFEEQGHTTHRLAFAETMDSHAVRDVAAAFAPDIFLILHAWRCATVVHALRDSFRSPIVVSLRGTDAYQMLDDPLRGPTVLGVLEKCDAITVFHESMLEQLALQSSQLGEKALVIPNGLALSRSKVDYRAELGLPPKAFVFVNVGGLREVKGQLVLLERLSRLRAHFPEVLFIHAGPVVDLDVAEQFRIFADANPWVHHRDEVPHAEIDSFLRAGSVYTSASRSEGMPHAVREAMAVGLPALLADIPGHRSMAEEGSEALFFQDAYDFEHHAARLIEDESLRRALGAGARKRIDRDLAGQDEVGSHLALFRGLLDSRVAASIRAMMEEEQ